VRLFSTRPSRMVLTSTEVIEVRGLRSGKLNFARYLFKAGAGVSFLSGSVLLTRRTSDVRSLEIVLLKLSSMVPSTASRLVIAGASRALLQGAQCDGSGFLLSPPLSAGYWLERLLRREIGMRALPLLSWDRTCSRSSSAAHPNLWVRDREN